jgi:lipid II:glycine glycyltransferase (peptidoglycan interpeptide bridge formation enzyme)
MKILINNQIDKKKWITLMKEGLYASPFQTPDYYDLFNKVNGLSADVFAVEIEENYTSLVVVTIQKENGIKALFSHRGIIYGGPLLSSGYDKSVEYLFKYLTKYYYKKLVYLEVRNYWDYSNYLTIINNSNWKFIPWLNFKKDISNIEIATKSMSNSRMRQIKKAKKTGVQWKEASDENEVKEFYIILKALYKKRVKKPLFPFSFFKEFFDRKIGVFLLVLFKGRIIGGIMCPILLGKTIYEFYVCGLDDEYKEQYPSVMATWAAIEYGLQNKIPLFDFMGAGSPNQSYGVREFKARFGGKMVEHGRFLKVLNPMLFNVGKLGIKVLEIARR